MRETLIGAYLDYHNNYVSYRSFAEQNGRTEDEALDLIALCKRIMSHHHPEAQEPAMIYKRYTFNGCKYWYKSDDGGLSWYKVSHKEVMDFVDANGGIIIN